MGRGSSDKERVFVWLTKLQLKLVDQVEVNGNNRGEKIRNIVSEWLQSRPEWVFDPERVLRPTTKRKKRPTLRRARSTRRSR